MLGALIGAGTSLLGGILGNKSAEDAAAANLKAQKQFAQKGIQWKVEDAKAAGIHPLYALGAQTTSFQPSYIGSNSLAEGVAQAGQNIGRAIDSGMSGTERLNSRLQALAVQRAELENTKLASEIALIQQPGSPPSPQVNGTVIPGQGNAVVIEPDRIPATAAPGIAAGAPAETTMYQSQHGYTPGMSEEYQEGQGEGVMGQVMYGLRNYIAPFLGKYHKGLPEPKPGHMWIWNPVGFEYVQTPIPNYNLRRK